MANFAPRSMLEERSMTKIKAAGTFSFFLTWRSSTGSSDSMGKSWGPASSEAAWPAAMSSPPEYSST